MFWVAFRSIHKDVDNLMPLPPLKRQVSSRARAKGMLVPKQHRPTNSLSGINYLERQRPKTAPSTFLKIKDVVQTISVFCSVSLMNQLFWKRFRK